MHVTARMSSILDIRSTFKAFMLVEANTIITPTIAFRLGYVIRLPHLGVQITSHSSFVQALNAWSFKLKQGYHAANTKSKQGMQPPAAID